MAVGESYRELVNIRPVGTEPLVYDYITIPGTPGPGEYVYRITELPLNVPLPNPDNSAVECREVDAFNVELPGPVRLTPIDQFGVLTPGKFIIKSGTVDVDDTFKFGIITFSQFDAGRRFKVMCTGRGSLVYASDVTDICKGLSLLPGVIKPGHISTDPADDFAFPGDVNIAGDMNIAGEINKIVSETVTTTDTFLRLNDDFTTGAPTADGGIQLSRGNQADAALQWTEGNQSWDVLGGTLRLPATSLDLNHNQAVSMALQYVADATAETALVASAVDGQVIYRIDSKAMRIFDATLGAFKSTSGAIAPTGTFFVDGNRVDVYTEDGSFVYPYKTIQAAVDAVAALNDSTKPYTIAVAGGLYEENVVVEDAGLYDLCIAGYGLVILDPAAGLALQSTATNDNLNRLHIYNVKFEDGVSITGSNGTTSLADVVFFGCDFNTLADISITCANGVNIHSCNSSKQLNISNVGAVSLDGGYYNDSDWTIASDSVADLPSSAPTAACAFITNGVKQSGLATLTIGGTGTLFIGFNSSNISAGAVSVPAGVVIDAYSSTLPGAWTNLGQITLRNSTVGTLSGAGTVNLLTPSSQLQNDSALVSGTSVADALDTLARFPQPTKTFHVDVNRADVYTEDGSTQAPFKTIQGAVDAIAALADTGNVYAVSIASGIYPENIVLEDTDLGHIVLQGSGIVNIDPASGVALQSTTNNGNLDTLYMRGLTFRKPILITGANGTTAFTDVVWSDCNFVGTGNIALTCINTVTLNQCYSECNITYVNVNWCWINGGQLQGALSLSADSTLDVPSAGSACTVLMEACFHSGSLALVVGGAATQTLAASGSRVGGSGSYTIPVGATVLAYASYFRGTLVNNGTLTLRGSFVNGTISGAGTTNLETRCSQVQNDSSVSGTSVKDALETLAAAPAPSGTFTKYTKTYSDLSAAALTNNIELFSLPAKGVIGRVIIKHNTAFSGTGITGYTVSVGIVGDLTKYASAFDVLQATGNQVAQITIDKDNIEDFGSATSIRLAATSVGANLDQGAAGSVDVYVEWATLP